MPNLWLAERGAKPLIKNGIKLRLKRLGLAPGVDQVHAHRRWHNLAYERKRACGNTGDLVLPLGWTLEDMPARNAQRASGGSRQVLCRSAKPLTATP